MKESHLALESKTDSNYNAFNVYRRELAPGTVSLTGYRAQGDDSQHCAYCRSFEYNFCFVIAC